MRIAQEGAEDNTEAAASDLSSLNLNPELDSLIGIAASGRTPYVLGAMEYAKKLGCITIGLACSDPSAMSTTEGLADYMISAVTGPEVVTGSTRMKAGTATKLVLNMLSTGIMIKIGKTYGNMVSSLVPCAGWETNGLTDGGFESVKSKTRTTIAKYNTETWWTGLSCNGFRNRRSSH